MSQQYQVLARKYRPKNFHELVGQSHVSKALINAIDHNRLHHAYLFTGTRGVGKTTIARILSKCLNCETGITSTPCGVCSSCVAIDEGRFIDLIEIDAASRTKVEDTRELIENVPYAPTQGRYKVYLIDEVHMLSTHSFNALLKTLEEPPSHVKFLLATTDPQKLPITIISRCLQFVLRPLSQQAITEHLANLLNLEQVDYTQPALWQLANAAKGSVRDALSLTDQAIAFGQGALTDETVNDMLGLINNADLVKLLLDIYQGNTEAVSVHIEQMRAQMVDAGSMFDGLAELLHQIAMLQLLPNVSLNVNDVQAQQIKQLADTIGPDVLQLYYQIVIQGREQIKLANTPLQALEMCLLRLLAFRPLAVNEVPMAPQSTNNANLENGSISEPVEGNPPQQVNDESISDQNESPNLVNNDFETNSIEADDNTPQTTDIVTDSIPQPVEQQQLTEDSPNPLDLDQTSNSDFGQVNEVGKANNNNDETIQNSQSDEKSIANDQQFVEEEDGRSSQVNSGLESEIIEKPIKTSNKIQNTVIDSANQSNTLYDNENQIQPSASGNANDVFESEASEMDSIKNQSQALENPDQSEIEHSLQPIEPVANDLVANDQIISETYVTSNNGTSSQLSVEDPRSLLKCRAVELEGEWTPEKWDYWLQTARESGDLAFDQLALARQGVMTGDISGQSVFKVAFDTKNMQSIFRHLADHLDQQFGAEVSIAVDTSLNSDCEDLLPQHRQKVREVEAKKRAKELIIQSPVMQRLILDSKGEISNLKLLNDTE